MVLRRKVENLHAAATREYQRNAALQNDRDELRAKAKDTQADVLAREAKFALKMNDAERLTEQARVASSALRTELDKAIANASDWQAKHDMRVDRLLYDDAVSERDSLKDHIKIEREVHGKRIVELEETQGRVGTQVSQADHIRDVEHWKVIAQANAKSMGLWEAEANKRQARLERLLEGLEPDEELKQDMETLQIAFDNQKIVSRRLQIGHDELTIELVDAREQLDVADAALIKMKDERDQWKDILNHHLALPR